MRVQGGSGFTVVEALIAALVLSTGILALVGSAALTSRMIGRGGLSTRAAMTAASRIDRLHHVAFSTVPPCTAPEWRGGSAGAPGLMESWDMLDPAGPARQVRVVLRTRHPTGVSSDTVVTGFLCGPP